MLYEKDYMMRLIHQMVRAILKLIFQKDEKQEELEFEKIRTSGPYLRLIALTDKGRINEAENELFDLLDKEDSSCLRTALYFYQYLNEMTDDELKRADYSREEIKLGMETVLAIYGYSGLGEMLLKDLS